MKLNLLFQLNDLKKTKVIICTPKLSSSIKQAVEKSDCAREYGTQIVSLGECDGFSNLHDLMKDASDQDAPPPITIDDPEKEKMMIFWSSGTTGTWRT